MFMEGLWFRCRFSRDPAVIALSIKLGISGTFLHSLWITNCIKVRPKSHKN